MLIDLFILIFLCWRIKNIVLPKGYRAGLWQFYTVLVWLGGELFGCIVSYILGKSIEVIALSGLLCAVLAYLVLQQKARSLKDLSKNTDELGDR